MELESLYQEVILDHYKRPHHKGLSEDKDVQVHHVNPSCGDEVTLNLTLSDGVVTNISWDGVGCSISQASTSIMTDLVMGKSVSMLDRGEIERRLASLAGNSQRPAEPASEAATRFADAMPFCCSQSARNAWPITLPATTGRDG